MYCLNFHHCLFPSLFLSPSLFLPSSGGDGAAATGAVLHSWAGSLSAAVQPVLWGEGSQLLQHQRAEHMELSKGTVVNLSIVLTLPWPLSLSLSFLGDLWAWASATVPESPWLQPWPTGQTGIIYTCVHLNLQCVKQQLHMNAGAYIGICVSFCAYTFYMQCTYHVHMYECKLSPYSPPTPSFVLFPLYYHLPCCLFSFLCAMPPLWWPLQFSAWRSGPVKGEGGAIDPTDLSQRLSSLPLGDREEGEEEEEEEKGGLFGAGSGVYTYMCLCTYTYRAPHIHVNEYTLHTLNHLHEHSN